jgi:hypothetical protein
MCSPEGLLPVAGCNTQGGERNWGELIVRLDSGV